MKSVSLHRPLLAGGIAAALALVACNSDNNSTPPLTGAFRITNGISDSDASGLGTRLNDVSQANNILFPGASGITNPPIGNFPADMTINGHSFTVDHVEISHNNLSTVLTYGTVGASTFNGFIAHESLVAPGGGHVVVQPLHSAYQQSLTTATLSYYFVAAGSGSIGSATPVMATFATDTVAVTLPGGNYEIIVTNGVTTVFDSGAGAGVTLPPNGTDVVQLAAVDAPGQPNGSSISLLLLDNGGGTASLVNGAH